MKKEADTNEDGGKTVDKAHTSPAEDGSWEKNIAKKQTDINVFIRAFQLMLFSAHRFLSKMTF